MKRPKLTTILAGVGLFLFFLVLLFPYQNLRGWLFGLIQKNTGIFITADDLSVTFLGWPGLKLHKMTASVPLGLGGDLELMSDRTTVRAGIGGIFPPFPTVSLSMDKLQKGGDLYVKVGKASTFVKGSLEAENFAIDQIPIPGMSEPLSGIFQADGSFNYNLQELSKTTGEINLKATKFRVPPQNIQGIVLPQLVIGDLKSKLIARNGNLEITNFQLGNPSSDIKGTMSGELRMGKDLWSSYLNLTLKLQLSDRYRNDPASATLVSFLQSYQSATPGDYGLKWSASIQEMATNIVTAIPQKAN